MAFIRGRFLFLFFTMVLNINFRGSFFKILVITLCFPQPKVVSLSSEKELGKFSFRKLSVPDKPTCHPLAPPRVPLAVRVQPERAVAFSPPLARAPWDQLGWTAGVPQAPQRNAAAPGSSRGPDAKLACRRGTAYSIGPLRSTVGKDIRYIVVRNSGFGFKSIT